MRFVDNLLDILTGNEHSKTKEIIAEREQEREREEKREKEEREKRLQVCERTHSVLTFQLALLRVFHVIVMLLYMLIIIIISSVNNVLLLLFTGEGEDRDGLSTWTL